MAGLSYRVRVAFAKYKDSRCLFFHEIGKLDCQEKEVRKTFQICNFLSLLMTSLEDPEEEIRSEAADILMRYIRSSEQNAKAMIVKGYIPVLLEYIDSHPSIPFRAHVVGMFREICRYDFSETHSNFTRNALNTILQFANHPNEQLKNAIGWTLAYMTRHSRIVAEEIGYAGAIPIFIEQIRKDNICVKTSAAAVMCDLAQQSEDAAQIGVESSCIIHLAMGLQNNENTRFKTLCLQTLATIASYRKEWTDMIIQSGSAKYALRALDDEDIEAQGAASTFLAQIMKYSEEIALFIGNQDCIDRCYKFIVKVNTDFCKSAIFCIGYICSASSIFSWNLIQSKDENGTRYIKFLESILLNMEDDEVLQAIVWAMGEVGKHSSNHTEHVCRLTTIMKSCMVVHSRIGSSFALKNQCMFTLLTLLYNCEYPQAINNILCGIHINYLTVLLPRLCQIVPVDHETRVVFFTSGALEKMQEIKPKPGSKLQEQVFCLNSCYPPDVIKYFNPKFDAMMMSTVDEFCPQLEVSADDALLQYIRQAKEAGTSTMLKAVKNDEDREEELLSLTSSRSSMCNDSVYNIDVYKMDVFGPERELFKDDLTVESFT